MASSVNKITLIGNLGKDPELRTFDNGGSVLSFPLATTESYRNRESGERVTLPTDWHNVVVRKPGLIKIADAYLKKGDRVYLEGKVRYRSYDKEGQTRYITEVVVEDITLISQPSEGKPLAKPQESEATTKGQDQAAELGDLPF